MSAAPLSGRERWDEIQRLFTEALDLPSTARARFLKEATTDEIVREEVESLLAAHARVTGPLDGPSSVPSLREEPLQPGERLGPYEIAAPLGRGGMGVVFVAHDMRLGRDVAIKLLAPWLAGEPQALRRFEREGRAVAALAHPNIVSLFDVGQEGERAYAGWSSSRARPSASASTAGRSASARPSARPATSRAASPPPTPRASSTATSSPRTCS